MPIPLWSIVTLGTEIVVSGFVYFIIYEAYTRGAFHRLLAFLVLGYEIVFNISYMLSRLAQGTHDGTAQITTPYQTGLAIFHGTFSLIMFISLVVFFVTAALRYARGENFFHAHPRLTITFCIAWFISVLSGIAFFIALYLV